MVYQELQDYLDSQESKDTKDQEVSMDPEEIKEHEVKMAVLDKEVFQVHVDHPEISV